MARNFVCPETETTCVHTRCKKGQACAEKEKQIDADNRSLAAHDDLATRRWKYKQELRDHEANMRLARKDGWGRKPPKISN